MRKSAHRSLYLLTCTALLAACANSSGSSNRNVTAAAIDQGVSPDGGTDEALPVPPELRVRRDERGVPHVEADSFEDAMYATGFVHAEDRLFQMHYRRSKMQGRLAEYFAVPAATRPQDVEFNDGLIESDRRFRTYGIGVRARRTVAAMPDEHRALLEAYAAGVNAQLEERPALGTAFEEAGVTSIEPWSAADALLGWEAVAEVFGTRTGWGESEVRLMNDCASGTCPALTCAELVVDEETAVVPPPADGQWPPSSLGRTASLLPGGAFRPPVDIKASQGFVVAGHHLDGGQPLIFGEPQIFLEAPSTWYELHVTVESEQIDVRGVGFAGSPGMVIFYNRHVSQTVTAGGGDVADLFRLTATADGRSYLVDGVELPFSVRNEVITVRGGTAVPLDVLESRYGPVVSDVLRGVPSETLLALRHASSLRPGDHSVIAGIELMRSDTLESYRDALRHWVTPPLNALYAGVDADDGESHIAYHSITVIADRAQQVIGDRDVTGRHPYDGSDSSQEWRGQLELDWNPHVIDPASGYLFSGNHLPVGTWYDAFVYSGIRGGGDSYRSFEIRRRLPRMLEAPGTVSAEALHALHVDADSEVGRLVVGALREMRARGIIPADDADIAPRAPTAAASRVLTGLERWLEEGGGTIDQRVAGDMLLRRFMGRFTTAARQDLFACRWGAAEAGAAHFLREFASDPSVLGDAEAQTLIEVSRQALTDISGEYGVDVSAWPSGDVAPYVVPFQRNFDCLRAGAGTRNCSMTPAFDQDARVPQDFVHTIASSAASSWPFTVDFADVDGARALLAPGVSEEPRSPHFGDQLPLIEAKGRGDADAMPIAPLDPERITFISERSL